MMLYWDMIRSGCGILLILMIAWLCSENRSAISRKVLFWGLVLQWIFALLVLKLPLGRQGIEWISLGVANILSCGTSGAEFLFGKTLVSDPNNLNIGFIFAFKVLPVVIYMAALFAVLYHYGIMQFVVRGFAWVMARLMGTSGAESLNAAASVLLGQTESPLTIRPYLLGLTRSELLTVMTAGMATVSGSVMAAYFAYGVEPAHILTASIMVAPGSILLSKILIPETGVPETLGLIQTAPVEGDANVLDAIARGTRDGLHLALNIGAMLIAFLGLIALVNMILAQGNTSLAKILGVISSPIAYFLGVPWEDCPEVGGLLGLRTISNEMLAYEAFQGVKSEISARSATIATFALCGFANISSIGIQIGGLGALVPERRSDLARLGWRALLAATLANFLTACIAGILL